MKVFATLFLCLATILVFGQETKPDSMQVELLNQPQHQYFDSVQKGLADFDNKRVLFIAEGKKKAEIVDKAYFDVYRTKFPKGAYSTFVFDNDYTERSGGYLFMVHIPQGGLTDKEFDRLFKELQERKTDRN